MRNRQVGPSESVDVLAGVVARTTYKPGWTFELRDIDRGQGCQGLTLLIGAIVKDSSAPGSVSVLHLMPVLSANYDEDSWIGWVLEQVHLVEQHEMLEFFKIDGSAPFFPGHGPGRNPYGVSRVIHALPKTEAKAYAEAEPWYGNDVSDPHITGA